MPEVARGDATVFGLSSLLGLLEAEAFSGRMVYGSGVIAFARGAPVRAELGARSGVPALLELFLEPAGTFVIERADVAAGPPLGDPTALLLEGCRLQDEWARLAPIAVLPQGPLPPALQPLVALLDGRPLVDAVAAAGLARAGGVDPLLAALEAGTLVETLPRRPTLPTDFDAELDAARRAVREGRLDDARGHFQRALSARPDDRIARQNLRRLDTLQGAR
jgi:hypothetical protein